MDQPIEIQIIARERRLRQLREELAMFDHDPSSIEYAAISEAIRSTQSDLDNLRQNAEAVRIASSN